MLFATALLILVVTPAILIAVQCRRIAERDKHLLSYGRPRQTATRYLIAEIFEFGDSICCEDDEFVKYNAKGLDSLTDGKFTSKGLVRGVARLGEGEVGAFIRWSRPACSTSLCKVESALIPDELPFWKTSSKAVLAT
jgi:hypothetical protein